MAGSAYCRLNGTSPAIYSCNNCRAIMAENIANCVMLPGNIAGKYFQQYAILMARLNAPLMFECTSYQLCERVHSRDVSFRNERFRRIESAGGLMRSGSRSCEPVVHLDTDGFVSYSYSSFTNLHRSQTISFTCQPLSKGNTDGYILPTSM